jgi:hypothetical protein
MAKKNEVQTTNAQYGAVTVPEGIDMDPTEYRSFLMENVQEGSMKFPSIKLLHAGAQSFQITTAEDKIRVEELNGVILCWYTINVFWEKTFVEGGGGEPANCGALRGQDPTAAPATVADVFPMAPPKIAPKTVFGDCDECFFNKFGSGRVFNPEKSTKRKACQNKARVFLLRPGEMIPYRLILPPSNIGPIKQYMVGLMNSGVPYWMAETTFEVLSEKPSSGGAEFSLVDPKMSRKLVNGEVALVRGVREQYLDFMRNQPVGAYDTDDDEWTS